MVGAAPRRLQAPSCRLNRACVVPVSKTPRRTPFETVFPAHDPAWALETAGPLRTFWAGGAGCAGFALGSGGASRSGSAGRAGGALLALWAGGAGLACERADGARAQLARAERAVLDVPAGDRAVLDVLAGHGDGRVGAAAERCEQRQVGDGGAVAAREPPEDVASDWTPLGLGRAVWPTAGPAGRSRTGFARLAPCWCASPRSRRRARSSR